MMLVSGCDPDPRGCAWGVLLVPASVLLAVALSVRVARAAGPSREALIARQRHQERLVRSARCVFEVVHTPTRPENIPLIQQACRLRYGPEQATKKVGAFVYSEKDAAARSYTSHWWRMDSKEREERTWGRARAPGDPLKGRDYVVAFDGHVVRSLGVEPDGQLVGQIDLPDGRWNATNRKHPFSFLYQYAVMPYSDILEKGTDFRLAVVIYDGKEYTRVSVGHPNEQHTRFVFLLDDKGRTVERELIYRLYAPEPPRTYQRFTFHDYRQHADPSGEVIWFPHKAVCHGYMDYLPDGRPVENITRTIIIRKIEFNVKIPDEMFTIQFPKGTKVWDRVTRLGVVEPIEDFDRFLEEAPRGRAAKPAPTEESTATRAKPATARRQEDRMEPASPIPRGVATPEPAAPGVGRKHWRLPAIIAAVLLAAAVLIILLRRRLAP